MMEAAATSELETERQGLERQVDALTIENEGYWIELLDHLVSDIKTVRRGEVFQAASNAVYVTKYKSKTCTTRLDDLDEVRHSNLYQILLGSSIDADYFSAFLSSDLGRLLLDSSMSGATIQRISLSRLRTLHIPVPPLDVQKQIAETRLNLGKLREAIAGFSVDLAVNPASSSKIAGRISDMLDSIGQLSRADHLRGKIRLGESKTLEFKQTLSLCVNKNVKEKYIEHAALKTIAAFMNTDGGLLLIGVKDDGSISGLGTEMTRFHKSSSDNLLLHFKNIFRQRIGEKFYPFLDSELVNFDGNLVLAVECRPSDRPCFLEKEQFFVRTNPATDQLKGSDVVDYVQSHFSSRSRGA